LSTPQPELYNLKALEKQETLEKQKDQEKHYLYSEDVCDHEFLVWHQGTIQCCVDYPCCDREEKQRPMEYSNCPKCGYTEI
jgi:ssDNA-binding Zn-finger/Zn-ribbon topoisomerase 1